MGSVKDLAPKDSPGGKLFHAASFSELGLGVWDVSGRSSVGDLKELIPPIESKVKGVVIATTTSLYWEHAANAGFRSAYVGMLDPDGKIVEASALLDRGITSHMVVMRLATTPHDLVRGGKITADVRAMYHWLIESGKIFACVADCENIFRWGFPLGSSTYKAIFEAAWKGDIYETLATYQEIVTALDQIRAIPGILERPEMRAVLDKAGLDRIPNPGHLLKQPVISYDTKFDPGGDKHLIPEEARELMHLDPLVFQAWDAELLRNAIDQYDWCNERGVLNIDGKTESLILHGFPMFTDFAVTVDENRLMIKYQPTPDSPVLLIPVNKEIWRATFRLFGIYAAKDRAFHDHGDDWHQYLDQYVSAAKIQEATEQSTWMLEQAIGAIGNLIIGQTIFDAEPVEDWVEPFLPYASVLQGPGAE